MMPNISVLTVKLYGKPIGMLTHLGDERSIFAFNDAYVGNADRETLGLSFKDRYGELRNDFEPTKVKLMPFFSNLLPEGYLRSYLAEKAGVNEKREFFLIQALGRDLPGAVTVEIAEDEAWSLSDDLDNQIKVEGANSHGNALRFSLAGVQLKFSAVIDAAGGLTIPASGMGGSWIVKLPSRQHQGVPENEFSMMTLARIVGINVPPIDLVDISSIQNLPDGIDQLGGKAFIIERFDRREDGTSVHIEDFAQVYGIYSEDKYKKASNRNIAAVIAAESDHNDVAEFIRRLTFNTLIGNGDMHLKNWSLIYPDRRNAKLSPAYDFVSTIPYIRDDQSALNFSRTRRFDEFTKDELLHLASKAALPRGVVLDTARETVSLFMDRWSSEKTHLPLSSNVVKVIDNHLKTLPIIGEMTS
ncbi:type II toxin-antitoxin system HipA family toxin [Gluconobacter wancherniae]|uniref:type II toxin-antitoxin system HipA family toxin n=1 Tax=Gluconobacter wancherniae TaxID=1307955 RepID=UPI001B8A9E2A|nr:type II toxin-antitoxin system HipA family toxin [Gluconobacter wancherniae]MBS1089951.1 type II toxin-antitoxin system HipA family toxin [Gluconobacter wancherniae]